MRSACFLPPWPWRANRRLWFCPRSFSCARGGWRGRWPWRHLGRLAPIFLMSVIATAVTIWPTAPDPTTFTDPHAARSWPERVATSGDVFWFYLGKLLWPYPLMAVYPRWQRRRAIRFLAAAAGGDARWPGAVVPARVEAVPALFLCAGLLRGGAPGRSWIDRTEFLAVLLCGGSFAVLACMGPLALVGAGLTWLGKRVLPARPGLEMIPGAALLLALGLVELATGGDVPERANALDGQSFEKSGSLAGLRRSG